MPNRKGPKFSYAYIPYIKNTIKGDNFRNQPLLLLCVQIMVTNTQKCYCGTSPISGHHCGKTVTKRIKFMALG